MLMMSEPIILNDAFMGPSHLQETHNVSDAHSFEMSNDTAAPKSATATAASHAVKVEDSANSGLTFHSELLESVFLTEDVDNTPMFDELDFVLEGTKKEDWVSLFDADHEVDNNTQSNQVVNDEDLLAPLGLVDDNEQEQLEAGTNTGASPDFRKPTSIDLGGGSDNVDFTSHQLLTPQTSSTLSTPNLDSNTSNVSSKKRKMDHLGCVKYSKKSRSQQLEPVKANSNDPILMKRAKNTEAARRSRARKMERMSQLEDRVEELIGINENLSTEMTRLKELLARNNISY